MMRSPQRIPYAKDLTPKNMLSKEMLNHLARLERQALDAFRAKTRTSGPTVQMSIRMKEEEYLRFRALCRAMRNTNGEMLLHLMNAFLEEGRGGKSDGKRSKAHSPHNSRS